MATRLRGEADWIRPAGLPGSCDRPGRRPSANDLEKLSCVLSPQPDSLRAGQRHPRAEGRPAARDGRYCRTPSGGRSASSLRAASGLGSSICTASLRQQSHGYPRRGDFCSISNRASPPFKPFRQAIPQTGFILRRNRPEGVGQDVFYN